MFGPFLVDDDRAAAVEGHLVVGRGRLGRLSAAAAANAAALLGRGGEGRGVGGGARARAGRYRALQHVEVSIDYIRMYS